LHPLASIYTRGFIGHFAFLGLFAHWSFGYGGGLLFISHLSSFILFQITLHLINPSLYRL
jgi:hypothetical protein